jgi:TolA-binding protein
MSSLRYSWKRYKRPIKQYVQNELKQYQDTTNKKLEKTQKQLNELREDFIKLQTKTKETIKKKEIEMKLRKHKL